MQMHAHGNFLCAMFFMSHVFIHNFYGWKCVFRIAWAAIFYCYAARRGLIVRFCKWHLRRQYLNGVRCHKIIKITNSMWSIQFWTCTHPVYQDMVVDKEYFKTKIIVIPYKIPSPWCAEFVFTPFMLALFYHFSKLILNVQWKCYHVENKNLFILHSQYHGCCGPGGARGRGISSYDIDLVYPQYTYYAQPWMFLPLDIIFE